MAVKVFRPGSNKPKHQVQSNSQTTSTGITFVPTSSGNTVTIPGPWMSVPVGKGLINSGSGNLPIIDLDVSLDEDRDGLNCTKCKEFYPYAEPNQEDKRTLICFACRNGY